MTDLHIPKCDLCGQQARRGAKTERGWQWWCVRCDPLLDDVEPPSLPRAGA